MSHAERIKTAFNKKKQRNSKGNEYEMLSKKIRGENMHISVVAYGNVSDLTEKKNYVCGKRSEREESTASDELCAR